MRILLVHNFYGSSAPSGENQAFEEEKALLTSRGHEVREITRHSDEIRDGSVWGSVKGALATPWNPWMAARVKDEVSRFAPEVVHVHNTFPLVSPSIFAAIGQRAARVLTLHNYRLFCAAAIPLRAGTVCTACLDQRSVLPALKHACYRDSRVATTPLAMNIALHRKLGTWQNQVDAFVTLTDFQRDRLVAAGLPGDRVHVKPNFYPGTPRTVSWDERGSYAIYAGRLTPEKGVATLIAAWREWASLTDACPELRIAGEGPLRPQLEELARGLPVTFLGALTLEEAQAQIAHARLLVVPSECYEGFPMVLREAFAFGTPVAVSNLGPLPSIVADGVTGVTFEPGNARHLAQVLHPLWPSRDKLAALSRASRNEFELRYNEDANYRRLREIYELAMR